MMIPNSSVDVVVVGAGPSGTAFASQLLTLCPDKKVVLFETFEDYQRTHTLMLQPSAFNEFSTDGKIREIIRSFFQKTFFSFNSFSNISKNKFLCSGVIL